MSSKTWGEEYSGHQYRQKSNHYDYDDDEDDDGCGFICFALGVIFLFVGVAILATVIVYSQAPQDSSSVVSLTSTREIKLVSEFLMSTIEKPYSIKTIDHSVNKTSEIPYPLSLLILVYSKPESLANRNAIRETWMNDAHNMLKEYRILVRFTVPGLGLTSRELRSLGDESEKYRDMVVLTESDKTPESELLLFEMIWSSQKYSYKFLMKTRDNMYIRIDQLHKQVVQDLHPKAYLGYFEGNADPKNSGKLPEPDWFLCDRFIRFAHSGGYILSRVLVDRLLSQAKFLHPYNNEDVTLGTWLSPFSDVELIHNVNFDTKIGDARGCNNELIVFQPAGDDSIITIHKRIETTGHCCESEFYDTKPYSYDFYVLPSKCCSEL